jgi:hypothetical protein
LWSQEGFLHGRHGLAVPGSLAAALSQQVANHRTDTEGDANGLIGMLVHGLVGRFGALDRFIAYPAIDLFAAFQCGGETLAGFADLFSGRVGGRHHQGARVFGECAHVIAGCLCLFVHIFCVFRLFVFFGGKCAASSRCKVAGELVWCIGSGAAPAIPLFDLSSINDSVTCPLSDSWRVER